MLNTKISKQKIAEAFGYAHYKVFSSWTTKELNNRTDWMRVGAIMMQNGISHFDVMAMADKMLRAKEELKDINEKIRAKKDNLSAEPNDN